MQHGHKADVEVGAGIYLARKTGIHTGPIPLINLFYKYKVAIQFTFRCSNKYRCDFHA